jgi:hypothetical protein
VEYPTYLGTLSYGCRNRSTRRTCHGVGWLGADRDAGGPVGGVVSVDAVIPAGGSLVPAGGLQSLNSALGPPQTPGTAVGQDSGQKRKMCGKKSCHRFNDGDFKQCEHCRTKGRDYKRNLGLPSGGPLLQALRKSHLQHRQPCDGGSSRAGCAVGPCSRQQSPPSSAHRALGSDRTVELLAIAAGTSGDWEIPKWACELDSGKSLLCGPGSLVFRR